MAKLRVAASQRRDCEIADLSCSFFEIRSLARRVVPGISSGDAEWFQHEGVLHRQISCLLEYALSRLLHEIPALLFSSVRILTRQLLLIRPAVRTEESERLIELHFSHNSGEMHCEGTHKKSNRKEWSLE